MPVRPVINVLLLFVIQNSKTLKLTFGRIPEVALTATAIRHPMVELATIELPNKAKAKGEKRKKKKIVEPETHSNVFTFRHFAFNITLLGCPAAGLRIFYYHFIVHKNINSYC